MPRPSDRNDRPIFVADACLPTLLHAFTILAAQPTTVLQGHALTYPTYWPLCPLWNRKTPGNNSIQTFFTSTASTLR